MFWTMIIQKPPFIAFLLGCLDGGLGSVQSLNSVVFTWSQLGTGRVGAARLTPIVVLVETNIHFNEPIWTAGSVWHVLICLIATLSIAEGIWSGLSLQSPMPQCHHLLQISKSRADELSKSWRSCWLLFEIFVLAVCDISALSLSSKSQLRWVFLTRNLKLGAFFPVSHPQPQGMWLDRKSWKLSPLGATFTAVFFFFLGKIRKYVLCRSAFW